MYNTQLIGVSHEILKNLKVPHTKLGITKYLTEHPFYPSMQSLSDMLTRYQISNVGVKLSDYQLEELPLPFFAFVKIGTNDHHDFIGVTEVQSDTVIYYDTSSKRISRKEFNEMTADGIALLVESDEKSSEKEYKVHKTFENAKIFRNTMTGLGLLILFSLGIWYYFATMGFSVYTVSIISTVIIGLIISLLLVTHEFDKSNSWVRRICASDSKNNCDGVLNSSGSRIFGLSWAEIGLCYFSFQLFYLFNPSSDLKGKMEIVSFFTCLAVVYIPFSLIYQFIILRQLCKLCLTIQLILALQFSWSICWGSLSYPGANSWGAAFICIISPAILWSFLKQLLKKTSNSSKYEQAYKRLIRRQDILELSLSESPAIIQGWEELGGIVKGNPVASNVIVNVSNPYCTYCTKVHEELDTLLEYHNDIKVVTLYSIDSMTSDERNIPVRLFLALAEMKSDLLSEAIKWWHSTKNKDIKQLSLKFPVDQKDLEKQGIKIDRMRAWCRDAHIVYTPTLYFNGKRLPVNFELKNLTNIVFLEGNAL